ncbi:dihydrodipicolinate synthase family protein [Rhodobacterales bacterium 52_120_T64]|nr:dihydrodipicolinate synthase family protein [Rhodobacterales bacterium 52_120_T64]
MTAAPFTGVWPVAPTPFTDNGELDLESMKRVLDCIIDQGADGICILANFSEQFLLTDEERAGLTRLSLEHVAGRVPVIVTVSHFATQIVEERCRYASDLGAAMVMMMPPYHGTGLRADEEGVFEHFARAADAGGIPVMVQDAPLSGVTLPVSTLVRMAKEIPLLQYFKIETPQAASKLRSLIETGGDAIVGPFDGEESITLIADLNAGATGSMCSASLPELIREVVIDHRERRGEKAAKGYERILPLINFENRQCGWRACKTIMKEGGVISSEAVRHPVRALHPATRAELIELARPLDLIAMKWGG